MDEKSLRIEKIPITRTEVFDKLYSAIMSGYFKPGDRLVERDLSKILGVSRTPIREVLRELEQLNLVTSEPYKGVFVNKLTLKEADDIFIVRKNIESLAMQLCIENISKSQLRSMEDNLKSYQKSLSKGDLHKLLDLDDKFHAIIYESTDNSTLKSIINNLGTMINHYRYLTLPHRQEETYREHEQILAAIKTKDIAKATETIQYHIDSFWTEIKQRLAAEN